MAAMPNTIGVYVDGCVNLRDLSCERRCFCDAAIYSLTTASVIFWAQGLV